MALIGFPSAGGSGGGSLEVKPRSHSLLETDRDTKDPNKRGILRGQHWHSTVMARHRFMLQVAVSQCCDSVVTSTAAAAVAAILIGTFNVWRTPIPA